MDIRVKEVIDKLNEQKHNTEQMRKSKFLISMGLTEKEYAAYEVKCKGYDINENNPNNLISFTIKTNKLLKVNQVLPIDLNGDSKKVCITEYTYGRCLNENDECPECELQKEFVGTEGIRRYKVVPIDITDEDYRALKEAKNSIDSMPQEDEHTQNEVYVSTKGNTETGITIAKVLYFISFIIIIVSIACGFEVGEDSVGLGFAVFAAGFISGISFIAFGKVIELLNYIANK